MKSTLPLRDRKKAKQREALADASLRLFLRQGYTATTLEQISAECDVTVPTLLRYFPTKEDLLFARQGEFLEQCANLLTEAAATKTVVDVWLQFLRAGARRVVSHPEIINLYEIINGAPSLLAKFHTIIHQYEELLERALCEEAGFAPGQDLHAHLFARLLTTVPMETALHAIRDGAVSSMIRRMDTVNEYILANFKRPGKPVAKRAQNKRRTRVGK